MGEGNPAELYFYLPPGSFTSFDIVSFHFQPTVPSDDISLAVEFDGGSGEFPAPTTSGGFFDWLADGLPAFSDAHISRFAARLHPDAPLQFDLDSLVLVSVDLPSDVTDILILRFLAGYFARAEDHPAASLRLTNLPTVSRLKRVALQKVCQVYRESRVAFSDALETRFASLYARHQSYDAARREQNARQYERFREASRNSSIAEPGTSEPKTMPSRPPPPSTTWRSVNGVVDVQPPSLPSVFPQIPKGWRTPSTAQIRMCLEELGLMFSWDVERRTFCGIAEDDADPDAQRQFLFNVIHLLTLFGEFTGMIYDVRISMCDGWYQLQDRMSGSEIKMDPITTKTVLAHPYRAAVLDCLKKIVAEFHMEATTEDFIGCIDAAMHFHELLVD
jgi:hypothetical protein